MASEGIFVHACEGMASLAAAVAAAGGDAGKLSGRTVGEACDTITPLFCSLGMALKVRATAADGSSAQSQVPVRLSFLSIGSRLHHCANARVHTRPLNCRALQLSNAQKKCRATPGWEHARRGPQGSSCAPDVGASTDTARACGSRP